MMNSHIATIMTGLRTGTLKPVRKAIRTVSFAASVEDTSMLMTIAKHYGVSNSALGIELFAPLIKQLFKSLDADLQQKLALEADTESAAWMAKGGSIQVVPNVPPVNMTFWQALNIKEEQCKS